MKNRILVVDDEQSILDSFSRLLRKDGYTVLTSLNAQGALPILKSEQVDLVLIDVLMPEMSGIDLAKEIRKNPKTKTQKIVFVTVMARAGDEVNEAIKEIKPLAWLQKPIDVGTLRSVIKAALMEGEK